MKTIRIEKSNQLILVDDEDYFRVKEWHWNYTGTGSQRVSTKQIIHKGKATALANFIMNDLHGMYDHIDRNPLNNQRANLRLTNYQLNRANTTKDSFVKQTTSKYKGVGWHKVAKKWRAYITLNDKQISLGYFNTEEEAAKAYDKAALDFFKEFAYLNFQ